MSQSHREAWLSGFDAAVQLVAKMRDKTAALPSDDARESVLAVFKHTLKELRDARDKITEGQLPP